MGKVYLLSFCTFIWLASCETSNNNELQSQQAYIDSVARANTAHQDEINRKKNDSTINAIATARADSMQKTGSKTSKTSAASTGPSASIRPQGDTIKKQ